MRPMFQVIGNLCEHSQHSSQPSVPFPATSHSYEQEKVLDIAIPSPNDSTRTSYVMISRGKSRFVDEVHIPNAELR